MGIIKIVLMVLLGLVIIMSVSLYVQNQNPQIVLGLENGKLRELSNKPNNVSTQTAFNDKLVEPLEFKDSLEASKKVLMEALEAYDGIEIVKVDDQYIYAVATTSLMKFQDDIEIYFDENTNLIHYRSASRAGYSDMGLNRERYNTIADYYDNN